MSRTKLSLSDECETEQELYNKLCEQYNVHPKLDIAATNENKKCKFFCDSKNDALSIWTQWEIGCEYSKFDVWCNPPHKKTKAFVIKAHEQWKKHNINILMLVPLQTLGRKYLNDIFDNYITPKKGVEWHRVQPRPMFIHPDQKIQENAKQEYIVLIWRKKLG